MPEMRGYCAKWKDWVYMTFIDDARTLIRTMTRPEKCTEDLQNSCESCRQFKETTRYGEK